MAKILMVDDDVDFLEAGARILESRGHTVLSASNCQDGERKIKAESPDLVFLDIMMQQPDDGIVLAQKLYKEGLKVPIVMLSGVGTVTGYVYDKDDETLPCKEFLQKPIDPETLIQTVEKILSE
ncbi:MAG: response regulator [Candidatus Omnitrophota bacterium]